VVITRYTLPLPILRQIFGLLAFSRPMRAPSPREPKPIFLTFSYFLSFLLFSFFPSCYLPIPCQLRLKTLCTWSRNLKIFIFFPNYADFRAFTGGHLRIFLRVQLDCPWPEPYKARCPCHLKIFYLFWNTSLNHLNLNGFIKIILFFQFWDFFGSF
jgi:hypothetical protein